MTATSAEFWDRVAERYSKRAIADPETYERKLEATRALMHPAMKVLEFGCGTGSTALLHAPHVAHIDATDISAAMVAIGRDKAAQAGVTNLRFMQSGIEDFAAPDGIYDMVLALNLLHLVPELAAALTRTHGVLKPGGLFVSSTPCLSDHMRYLRPVIPVMRWLGMAPRVSFLSARGLEREVNAAGFVTQEHWTHGRSNNLFLVGRKAA